MTLSSIGEAVIATDEKLLVTFMNPVAEVLTGGARTEAIGRPLVEGIPNYQRTDPSNHR